ncbi:MAG: DUF975 family protein [Clostridia bacterium]|nr:DUF975 family protein [Clostridia bacterium]MBR2290121.1 DUF975 family protein [Clostridia bacterium]
MRIRELRAKAREDAQGNKWKLAWPLLITSLVIYLIGLIPDFLEEGPAKAVVGLLVFLGILFVSIAGSYAVIIRMLKVARKEEASNFFTDVFGEGMRHGFSCAWGIFKKIWYWMVLVVVGWVLLFLGGAGLALSELSGVLPMEELGSLEVIEIPTGLCVAFLIIGFVLVILSAIKTMIASYQYFLVTYLKHDYPDRSTNELLEKSKEMMDGNKAKAFVIPLTFFGWLLLAGFLGGIVSAIFNMIWPPEVTWLGNTISTVPMWAEILMIAIVYFIISFVSAYMQLTFAEFYLERNPLEIYHEDYVKPETNAKKYKKIIAWVYGIMIALVLLIPILAAIVINGAYNTPNEALFANFCQEYDNLQTKVQTEYYDLYLEYVVGNYTEVPSYFDIYKEVATGIPGSGSSELEWVEIDFENSNLENPHVKKSGDKWYLRTNDGKLAYSGFEKKAGVYYYTPSFYVEGGSEIYTPIGFTLLNNTIR